MGDCLACGKPVRTALLMCKQHEREFMAHSDRVPAIDVDKPRGGQYLGIGLIPHHDTRQPALVVEIETHVQQ